MKKILITGVNGFAGSHLSDYILKNKLGEVTGTIRGKSSDPSNIRHNRENMKVLKCDFTDFTTVKSVIRETEPDYIFHLAAQSDVSDSWKAPHETMQSNVLGSMNLFEAVREISPKARVQVASSSETYGMVLESELPIRETNPLRPLSPYGVSKAAMDMMAYQYNQSYGLHIVRTRAFNHTGPRRGSVFVTSNWSRQIAEIEKGLKSAEISVGALDSKRDFSDVRDVVRAYWMAIEKGEPGEVYNICSGKSVSMEWLLNKLLSMASDNVRKTIKVKSDPSRFRPSDVKVLEGDASKFSKRTGWKPEYTLEQTLQDLMDYWREKV